MRRRHGAVLAAAMVAAQWPGIALAQEGARGLADPIARSEPRREPEFSLDLTAATTLPLAVGGRVALEVPGHVVIHVTAGVVAVALVDAINDVGTGWGAWSEVDAQICRSMLGDATWLEMGVGLRPAGTPGIELSVGYAVLWSHRMASTLELGVPSRLAWVGLDVTVDAIHAELAWQTMLFEHVTFRMAIGWVHAVAHRVAIVNEAADDDIRGELAQIEVQLGDEVGRRAFGPTVGFGLGVRLF